ncbi:MAG: hypothetical protein HUJ28_02655 [Chromatiales bacterium]|nr:hypothetical protein [Chromatiales bacterium]
MSLFDLFKRHDGPGYRLHHHDPLKKRLKAFLLLALLAGSGWGLYQYGYLKSGYDARSADEHLLALRERVDYLTRQNRELTQQVAQLERSRVIEAEAATQVSTALSAMETEMLELREELSFYRSIVSPSKMEPGLHIQRLELERGEAEGEYHYKLVLTLVRGNNRVARGTVDMRVSGQIGGESRTLGLAEIDPGAELRFSFKYFQSLEGTLLLPAGFQPRKLEVKVDASDRRLDDIDTSYDWNVILTGENA